MIFTEIREEAKKVAVIRELRQCRKENGSEGEICQGKR